MTKAHFIIMPFFRMDVPPLSIACLYAYLKRHKLSLSCTDFRLFKNDVKTFAYLGYQDNFVMDIPDLPLILAVIKNYKNHEPLLKGMDEVVFDYIQTRPLSFFRLKKDIADIYNLIDEHLKKFLDKDVVLFPTYETNFFFTIMCSLFLRKEKPNIIIVYGGPQVSQSENSRKLVLKLGVADVVVIGEGEEVICDIVKFYKVNKSLTVEGTMTYDKERHAFLTRPRPQLDLEALSCPDFSLLNLNGYQQRNFCLPLYSSRGCLFRCTFCNEWKMWQPFRQLKPGKVIEWMKQLNRDYGAFDFVFADSLLNASLPWLEEFCDRLIKESLDFRWRGFFRANMSRPLAQKLKISGLYRAFIGLEAFSQTLLEGMNKKRSVRDNLQAVEAFSSCGISLEISNIIGFPCESDLDFRKRWRFYIDLFSKNSMNVSINVESFQLRPGSKIYDDYQSFGLSVKNWSPKFVNMLPEVSDIVSKIPMTVSGRPAPREIIKRSYFMAASLLRNEQEVDRASLALQKEFLKTALKHINYSSKIYFLIGTTLTPIKRKEDSRKEIFLIQTPVTKYIITGQEKMIFERLNQGASLSSAAEKLSKEFNINRTKCMQRILFFLNDLLERDILFDIVLTRTRIGYRKFQYS